MPSFRTFSRWWYRNRERTERSYGEAFCNMMQIEDEEIFGEPDDAKAAELVKKKYVERNKQ